MNQGIDKLGCVIYYTHNKKENNERRVHMSFGVRLRHLNLKLHTVKNHDLYAVCMQGLGVSCNESDFLFFNNKNVRHFASLNEDNEILLDLDQARKAGYSKILIGGFINKSLRGNLAQVRVESVTTEQEGGEIIRTFAIKECEVEKDTDEICEFFSIELQSDKGWKVFNRYVTYENAVQYLSYQGLEVS